MSFPGETDIVATTLKHRSTKLQDAVSRSNATYYRLQKKGRIKTAPGGLSIVEPIAFAENPNVGWYSGYDQLALSPSDLISNAEYAWKQVACGVVISGLEELQNSGPDALIDLLESRIRVTEWTMKNTVAAGVISDGTGSGGKVITGLDAMVPQDPTTGTYGGIPRATWTFWRSKLYDTPATVSTANVQTYMTSLYLTTSRGDDMVDLILAGTDVWTALQGSVQTLARFTDTNTANVGFPSMKFMGADVVYETGMTATDAYFLNTEYIALRPHKDRNFVPLSPNKRWSLNQDAEATILAWAGNLTCSNAALQGRLKAD